MPKYKLVVDSKQSEQWHGTEFGPFNSVPQAKKTLVEKGWFYQPRRVWTAQISRFNGIEGRLKLFKGRSKNLEPANNIPQGVVGYLDD